MALEEKVKDIIVEQLGVDANNGLGDVYSKIQQLDDTQREEIEAAIQAVYAERPALAMVNSDTGSANFPLRIQSP